MIKRNFGFKALALPCATLFTLSYGYAQEQTSNFPQGTPQDSTKVEQLDEVVVSDSRFELKRENSGKTVIKTTAKELKRNQGRSLAEIINAKSGIEVNGSRSYTGQNISVFARGGNNRQVLVVIDGIQVSDPSNVNAEYDLRLLNPSQIESIEILKGAASTLYGNSAATAVINITTKKAAVAGVSMEVLSSMGTNQSANDQNYNISDFSNTVTLTAKRDKLSFLASGGNQFTDGLSAAIGVEPDGFSRIDGALSIGYQFSKRFNINASAFYNKLKSDFDNGFPVEDADFNFRSEQSRFGLSSGYSYKNGVFKVNGAFNQITRSIDSDFPSAFNSKSLVLDIFNKYTFDDKFYTIVGVNVIENRTLLTKEETTTSTDPYLNVVYVSDFGLNINAGTRLNNHSDYGSNFIYNLNPSYRIKTQDGYVKFLGSYATSFIAPNLSQLYGRFGANPDLQPEHDTTLEGGIEYRPSNSLRISALYFDRKEKDFIDYLTNGYENVVGDRNSSGLEVELLGKVGKHLEYSGNYTFTQATNRTLLRVPKNKINATVGYSFPNSAYVSLSYQYNSDRIDLGDITLDNFSLVDLYISKEIGNRINFFFSINNLLNEEYLEISDYTTKGRNMRLGMRLKL